MVVILDVPSLANNILRELYDNIANRLFVTYTSLPFMTVSKWLSRFKKVSNVACLYTSSKRPLHHHMLQQHPSHVFPSRMYQTKNEKNMHFFTWHPIEMMKLTTTSYIEYLSLVRVLYVTSIMVSTFTMLTWLLTVDRSPLYNWKLWYQHMDVAHMIIKI